MNIFSCKGALGLKNTEYRRNRHSCYLLEYHLVVVTKYRTLETEEIGKKWFLTRKEAESEVQK